MGCYNCQGRIITMLEESGIGQNSKDSIQKAEAERKERAAKWADQRERLWVGMSDGIGRIVDTSLAFGQAALWATEYGLTGTVSDPVVSPDAIHRGVEHMNRSADGLQHMFEHPWESASDALGALADPTAEGLGEAIVNVGAAKLLSPRAPKAARGGAVIKKRKHARDVRRQGDVDHDQRWNKESYRGDTRSPEEIERAGGFKGTDPNADISLEDHMYRNRPPSQWVSTSQEAEVAKNYAGMEMFKQDLNRTYVYDIVHPGGVNVNTVPGITNVSNLEVAFSGGIPWSSVRGWTEWVYGGGIPVKTWVPNPAFVPP